MVYRYLKPLKPWLVKLEDMNTVQFTALQDAVFTPLMHTVLLIWQKSSYYNTSVRIMVLLREVCNAIIKRVSSHIHTRYTKYLCFTSMLNTLSSETWSLQCGVHLNDNKTTFNMLHSIHMLYGIITGNVSCR
jgi:Dynein heavy chain, N-terminal region 1